MKNRLQQALNAIALPFSSLKNIILRATAHSTLVSGQFGKTDVVAKDCEYNFKKKGNMSDSIIILILKIIPLNIVYVMFKDISHFFHKPIKTIKYLDHKKNGNKVISDHIIKIRLRKKDIFSFNKQVIINKLEFCFYGINEHGLEFYDKYPIERIDSNQLKFKENEDIGEFEIKIPFYISIKYFNCNSIELCVGYTSVNGLFEFDKLFDLKSEIINPFFDLTRKQLNIISRTDELYSSTEFRNNLKNQIKISSPDLSVRDLDEENELNDGQYIEDVNGNWIDKNGNTIDK